jgi:anti-sigma B factor antagonist
LELHERTAGHVVIIDVRGSIAHDAEAQTMLRDRLRGLLEQGYKFILLNVADVTYVDSVWLGAVVQGYASAIRQGGALKLLHVTKRFRDLLRMTKLDTVIDSFESEDAATASFGSEAPAAGEKERG